MAKVDAETEIDSCVEASSSYADSWFLGVSALSIGLRLLNGQPSIASRCWHEFTASCETGSHFLLFCPRYQNIRPVVDSSSGRDNYEWMFSFVV